MHLLRSKRDGESRVVVVADAYSVAHDGAGAVRRRPPGEPGFGRAAAGVGYGAGPHARGIDGLGRGQDEWGGRKIQQNRASTLMDSGA